jgi:hypothetical protein
VCKKTCLKDRRLCGAGQGWDIKTFLKVRRLCGVGKEQGTKSSLVLKIFLKVRRLCGAVLASEVNCCTVSADAEPSAA